MKKLILILAVVGMTSCSKNCDDLEDAAYKQYQDAVFRCGGSSACRIEIKRQYDDKIKRIRENCN
jgi:hypothetical protein